MEIWMQILKNLRLLFFLILAAAVSLQVFQPKSPALSGKTKGQGAMSTQSIHEQSPKARFESAFASALVMFSKSRPPTPLQENLIEEQLFILSALAIFLIAVLNLSILVGQPLEQETRESRGKNRTLKTKANRQVTETKELQGRSLRDDLATVSREAQAPLSAVKYAKQILAEPSWRSSELMVRRAMLILHTQTEKLDKLFCVASDLIFARKYRPVLQDHPLKEIVQSVLVEYQLRDKNAHMCFVAPSLRVVARFDQRCVERILDSILREIFKMAPREEVRVSLLQRAPWVVLEVSAVVTWLPRQGERSAFLLSMKRLADIQKKVFVLDSKENGRLFFRLFMPMVASTTIDSPTNPKAHQTLPQVKLHIPR
jgi:hypothetical protein